MNNYWLHKKVQTFRLVRTVKKNIPSGWHGDVISVCQTPNGKTLLAVVWEPTGEELCVLSDEIEELSP